MKFGLEINPTSRPNIYIRIKFANHRLYRHHLSDDRRIDNKTKCVYTFIYAMFVLFMFVALDSNGIHVS